MGIYDLTRKEIVKMDTSFIYTICSKTSHNNGRICRIKETKNPFSGIVMAQLVHYEDQSFVLIGRPFPITEGSLKTASLYDIIRNMDDTSLQDIIPQTVTRQLSNHIEETQEQWKNNESSS